MRRKTASSIVLAILSPLMLSPLATTARNQWDINHPDQPLPSAPIPGSPASYQGRNLGMDFWSGIHPMLASRIQPGVVLTTVMEHDISSETNKVGDAFALRLDDGYAKNGMQIIPPGSKIICSVTSVTPARSLRGGLAGRLQVSLQSLLLPDGQHIPIYGFIDSNPNHAFKEAPQVRNAGSDMRDYGQQVSGMMGMFTAGMGSSIAKRHRGLDFVLERGELVPVRLNRTLVLPESVVQPQTVQQLQSVPQGNSFAGPPPPAVSSSPQQSVPGLMGTESIPTPSPTPPPVDHKRNSSYSNSAQGGPHQGRTRANWQANSSSGRGEASMPSSGAAAQPSPGVEEPDVFQQPLKPFNAQPQSINDMPDPF